MGRLAPACQTTSQHENNRASCTESRRHTAIGQIITDQKLPNSEEKRGADASQPDVAPADAHVRQELENEAEQPGDDHKRNKEIGCLPDPRRKRKASAHVFTEQRQQNADDQ